MSENISASVAEFGTVYLDDAFGLAIPAAKRESAKMPCRNGEFVNVPQSDPQYLFRKDLVGCLVDFFSGREPRMMLTGETGTGKTSVIEQACARLNWPCVPVACHDKLELPELIGRITIEKDGSTGWMDGPALAAMRQGAVLLIDEGNFLEPGVVGGMNKILDTMGKGRTGFYLVPETGEVVRAHAGFRIAMTGNAIDGASRARYRGIKPMNIALLDRFTIGAKVDYMASADEIKVLKAKAPLANDVLIKLLVEFAGGIRATFQRGEIGMTLSTRMLVSVCEKLITFSKDSARQGAFLMTAFESSVLYRVSQEDREAFTRALTSLAQRNNIILGK